MSLMPDTLKTRTIFHGQVLEQLAKIPSGKINCSVTSPPYYHVRDYDFDGQWGQEKDPSMFLEHLAQFMQAMHRVTSKHGTVWVNIGDVMVKENWYGFPERFYVNALNAGWKSVSKVVWMKRNAMPSSTGKRFSPKWEPIYGFAKNDDYYFDKSKVLIPTTTPVKPFNYRVREGISGKLQKKFGNQYSATEKEKREHNKKGEKKQDAVKKGNYTKFNERYDHAKVAAKGKNPGDYWDYEPDVFDITVKAFKDAHFATFPPQLPERILLACCPPKGWVLDPFGGSGTVGLVAEKLKLNWILIEGKKEYINIAKRRIGID